MLHALAVRIHARAPILIGASILLGWGCGDAADRHEPPMDFTREAGFYTAPFPSEDLRGDDDRVHVAAFPNPSRVGFVDTLLSMVDGADGFGTTSEVIIPMGGPVDAAGLPDLRGSLASEATVFLMDVDPESPARLGRHAVAVRYEEDGGPFGTLHQLSLLPLQGLPLAPDRLYAAVVLRELGDGNGHPLPQAQELAAMVAGRKPAALSEAAWGSYHEALDALAESGVDLEGIASLAVFRTGDPTLGLRRARMAVLDPGTPLPEPTLPTPAEVFDGYCVFEATIDLPVFQEGEPPFVDVGGGWALTADAAPTEQGRETARLVVTVPRVAMPAEGFPLLYFIRTGGGGDRPLVDRGVHAEAHGEATPGTGPAQELARVGWAGASADGPHGGMRNVTGGDEQFLIFNVSNPLALRDNVRQSALETALLAQVLTDLSFDASSCPDLTTPAGDGVVSFDASRLALMGHSMGATIAPLVLAVEPRYRAAVLSGAGGSWIENVVYKKSPVEIRPFAELLLRYTGTGRSIQEDDPAVSLFQWAAESADPPVYSALIDQHVLMLQGIVDTYILPPIANATSLSLGLDLAGEPLDAADPDLAMFDGLESLLDLSGASRVDFPVQGNRGDRTRVVVQHPEDGIEDGHEVAFQTEPPKRQYRCFLQSFAAGAAPIVPDGSADIACD